MLASLQERRKRFGSWFQAFKVRNRPASFDRVEKSRRCRLAPIVEHFLCRQPIKRDVDFYGGKLGRVKIQVLFLWDFFRVKVTCPVFVNPTTSSDIDLSGNHARFTDCS